MSALAVYAARPEESRGRFFEEAPCPTRTVYQRDRDRIVHSTAFRRLIHKTQVFVYHEGDHYRTRLTHSLEVAQIARTLARTLDLNEDLTETIALAHDLGHTPFGHAGEDALNEAMQGVGGFDHNAQSLRIVTHLEHRYAAFRGLNLSWETLEGIVKHNGPLTDDAGEPTGRYAAKGLAHAICEFKKAHDLGLNTYCSLEGQIAAVADDIAYNNHDIDDGFRAGYITVAEMEQIAMAGRAIAAVRKTYGDVPGTVLVNEMNRRMIAGMVEDVRAEARRRIAEAAPRSIDDVRALKTPLVDFSPAMAAEIAELRAFLMARVYHHPSIAEKMAHAQKMLRELYDYFSAHPDAMSADAGLSVAYAAGDAAARQRAVGDFVAGMTDMFALKSHAAIFGGTGRSQSAA
jgi:dGTPase